MGKRHRIMTDVHQGKLIKSHKLPDPVSPKYPFTRHPCTSFLLVAHHNETSGASIQGIWLNSVGDGDA